MKHFNKNEEIFMENINSNEEIFTENRGRTKTNGKIKKFFVFMTPFIMGNALTLFMISPFDANPIILEKTKISTNETVSIDLTGKIETYDGLKYSNLKAVYQGNKDGKPYLITKTYSMPFIVSGNEVATAVENNDVSYMDLHFSYTTDVTSSPTKLMDIPNDKWFLMGQVCYNVTTERMETPKENLRDIMLYIPVILSITTFSGMTLLAYNHHIEMNEDAKKKTR